MPDAWCQNYRPTQFEKREALILQQYTDHSKQTREEHTPTSPHPVRRDLQGSDRENCSISLTSFSQGWYESCVALFLPYTGLHAMLLGSPSDCPFPSHFTYNWRWFFFGVDCFTNTLWHWVHVSLNKEGKLRRQRDGRRQNTRLEIFWGAGGGINTLPIELYY